MSGTAIATMLVIMSVVWGGFLLILAAAFMKERTKKAEEARRSGHASTS